MDLNSAIGGVIVGSLLSLAGNIVNHWFSMRKEKKQWERQQIAEDKKRRIEDEKQKVEDTRNVYHNCISRLAFIVAIKKGEISLAEEKMQIIYQEAFDYLSSLFLHQQELHEKPTRSLQTKISHFSWNPEENVSSVLQEVYDLAIQDKVLFPKVKPKKCDPYIKEFVLNIDKDFIKQQMIEGKLLKSPDIFECDISKLSSSQREKLWDQQGNKIPDRIHLKLPGINSNSNQIDLKVPDWLAKLIRNEKLPEEILNEWEKDYDEALDKAESAVKKND